MTRSVFQRFARNADGEAIPLAEVDVVISNGPVADIYADATGGVAISQPMIADANGYFRFYVEPGIFDVTATDPVLFSSVTFPNEEIGASRESLIDDNQHVSPYSSLNPPPETDLINDLSQAYTFKTVALMQASLIVFPVGKKIFWQGYYTESDGGSNWGLVVAGSGINDGGSEFTLADGQHVQANLKGKSLNTAKFGVVSAVTAVLATTDSKAEYQLALDYAHDNDLKLVAQGGKIFLGSTIDVKGKALTMDGQGIVHTEIIGRGDYTIFEHTSRFVVSNMTVTQDSGTFEGMAFATEQSDDSSAQALYCSWKNIVVGGFDFSWWLRASVWCTWKNVTSTSIVGIRGAMNADPYDVTSDAPDGWNKFDPVLGWFHNQNSIKSSNFQDAECGIFGCFMGLDLNTVTTQGQLGDKANNKILPVTEERTGTWLHSGRASEKAFGNAFQTHYAEACRRPIYVQKQRTVTISTLFIQGGLVSDKFKTPIEIDDSAVFVDGVTGQDWFDSLAILKNNSQLYGKTSGAVTGNVYDIQDTSMHYANREQEIFTRKFAFSTVNATDSFTIPVTLNNNSHYDFRVGGLYNGSQFIETAYDVFRINSESLTGARIRSGTETNFNTSIVGDKLVVNKTGALAMSFWVVITEVSTAITMEETLLAD